MINVWLNSLPISREHLLASDTVHVLVLQTLGSDWRMYTKKDGNTDGMFKPLGQIKWHRVVLDVSGCTLQAKPARMMMQQL